MAKTSIINVQGIEIALKTINDEDYISLTDIIKAKDGDFFISDWLRNRNTLEYLGAWVFSWILTPLIRLLYHQGLALVLPHC